MCFNPICDQRHHADKTERQQELSSAGIAQRHEGDETPCSTRLACVPLVLLSVFTFAACSDQSRPMLAPGGISGQLSQGGPQPFYYYQGQPIYLQIDSTRVVVETTEPSALAAAQSVLAPLGVATQDDGIIGQSTSHHRILRLAGATAQAAQRALQLLRADGRFTFASHIYNTLEGGHLMMPLNRLAVRFRPGVTVQQVDSINKVLGTRTISPPVPDSGYLSWRVAYPVAADPLAISQTLYRSPLVKWADPEVISDQQPTYVPTDPFYPLQFHLKNSNMYAGVRVDINIEPAWDLTLGSSSVKVAIIDDGVDALQGNSGGGFAGDFLGPFTGAQGYDLLYDPSRPGESSISPCCNDTHGTSVAGIIAATHNNGVGGAGIAPNTVVNVVRIFRKTYPPESFTRNPATDNATNVQIAAGINWAVNFQIASAVLSNSWGGGNPSDEITGAINNALTNGRGGLGAVVVFSAGNTSARSQAYVGPVQYPASLSSTTNVISVGAIDRYGNAADYTPDGVIDVVAPSGAHTGACLGEIITMDRYGSPGCNDGPSGNINYTSTFSGTSAAAPQVAGVAALLLSREPSLTAAAVRSRLRDGADPWGPSTTFGAGKLNAYGTLVAPPRASISGPNAVTEYTSNTWTAVASGGAPPFTYRWTVDGTPAGTSTSVTDGGSWAGGTSHTIGLTVTDVIARSVSTSLGVYVTFSGGCFQPPCP